MQNFLPLQIILFFETNDTDDKISKEINPILNLDPNQKLSILPKPNYIRISGEPYFSNIGNIIMNSHENTGEKIIGIARNINPTHFLITQINKELKENINIDIVWENWNESLTKKRDYFLKFKNHFETIINSELEQECDSLNLNSDPYLSELYHTEGYILRLHHNHIIIQADTPHGLFNGFQTLKQLLYSNTNKLPTTMQIIDWPSLKIRGVADDISRGQIPTVESAKRYIKLLSEYKNNHYALYFEDTFQSTKYPKIGRGRGAFTPDEIREIDEYAKTRFVTLFPILETLGHMDNILTIPEYEDLGEFPGAQCFSLGNGNIYPMLNHFIEEMSDCFSSDIFHLGGDETFDLGHGNSKEIIKALSIEQALYEHYRRISKTAKRKGKNKIMLYHDIVAKYPELLKKFPEDIIIMYWNYAPKKTHKKLFSIQKSGLPIIVSPSMLCWTRHFPDFETSSINTINLIEQAKSMRLLGQLNSTWGDFGNSHFRENTIYGAILSASASWTSKRRSPSHILKDIGIHHYGLSDSNSIDQFLNLFTSLVNLKKYYISSIKILPQSFFTKLFKHPFIDSSTKPIIKNYKNLLKESTNLLERMNDFQIHIRKGGHFFQYLTFSSKLIYMLALKDKMRVSVNSKLKKLENMEKRKNDLSEMKLSIKREITEFHEKMQNLKDQYEKLWLLCAKKQNSEFTLQKFSNLLNFCDKKISLLENNVFFQNPMLKSKYIWDMNTNKSTALPRFFRKEFNIEGKTMDAKLQVIAGNVASININGQFLGKVYSRMSLSILALKKDVRVFDITPYLKSGKNVIAIKAIHSLQSRGMINVYMECAYIDSNSEKQNQIRIYSDESWKFRTLPTKSEMWTQIELPQKERSMWENVVILGKPPEFNGDLYHPNLLKGEKSMPQDFFGVASQLYYMLYLFLPAWIAKRIRKYTKFIAKLLN